MTRYRVILRLPNNELANEKIETILFPKTSKPVGTKRVSDFYYIQKELLHNGMNKNSFGQSI